MLLWLSTDYARIYIVFRRKNKHYQVVADFAKYKPFNML